MEVYDNICIPIFPGYNVTWPCQFILVKEEGKAYFIAEGDHPPEFGDCCILAEPFQPPQYDFTNKFNYNGTRIIGDAYYHEFFVNVPMAGGYFKHYVETGVSNDVYGISFNKMAFFMFTGMNNAWCYQPFYNFKTDPFDSAKQFAIPDKCRDPNIKCCPGFCPSSSTASSSGKEEL